LIQNDPQNLSHFAIATNLLPRYQYFHLAKAAFLHYWEKIHQKSKLNLQFHWRKLHHPE